MNAQSGKDENKKFGLHNLLNTNAEYLMDFSFEKYLNT